MRRTIVIAILLLALVFAACKKVDNTQSCRSTIFGYTGRPDALIPLCSFGTFHSSSSSLTSVTSFNNTLNHNQGAYNQADHCYYVFGHDSTGRDLLYRINLEGKVTTFTSIGTGDIYEGLVYSSVGNKLYCIRQNGNAGYSFGTIMEVMMGTSTFDVKKLAESSGRPLDTHSISATIDNATGYIYYTVNYVDGKSNIEKYNPRRLAPEPVAFDATGKLFGLQFNKNNNNVYGIWQGNHQSDSLYFVKVRGDSVVKIKSLPFTVDLVRYSTCIDHCSNRYILASAYGVAEGAVWQLDTNGALQQTDINPTILQGLNAP